MAGKNTAVFGIYKDRAQVERGVDGLKAAGFSNADISALFPQGEGTKDFATEKHTKAPEGATAGAGTGVLLGGGLGWLAGIGSPGDTWLGTIYRSRANRGCSCRRRSGWSGGRFDQSVGRDGHS
jgi:hypothetical protein